MSTTPLEREILTHYYCYPTKYKEGSENWSDPVCDAVEKLLELGLLKRIVENGNNKIIANKDALEVYMDALAQVPLPVQVWAIPTQITLRAAR